MVDTPAIGCLALQGCVERHRPHVEAAGASFTAVKTPAQFAKVDGFILPGGESTTMLKLIDNFNLWDVLAAEFSKKPVWGICAGSILLAEKVLNPKQKSFGVLPITVERNGYGRQLDSHHAVVDGYEVSLIRAPVIKDIAKDVETLASHDGDPVWIRHGMNMATTFHPELTFEFPSPMHSMFVEAVRSQLASAA